MRDALVYSLDGEYYFLSSVMYGRIWRIPLGRGRYMGTLTIRKPVPRYIEKLDLYTPHPEYRMAWLNQKDNTLNYDMVFYDNTIVSHRFMENALTTAEDIDKVLMTQAADVFGIGSTYYEEGTMQFDRYYAYTLSWECMQNGLTALTENRMSIYSDCL